MHVDLDIPGGPISVVLTGVETDTYSARGWWTVGGRKLLCSKVLDEPWKLTGHGLPIRRTAKDGEFRVPPKSLRVAFRAFLLSKYRAGAVVNAGVLDRGHKEGQCSWGYDSADEWYWSTPNDGDGCLVGVAAVKWMAAQGRAVGVRVHDGHDNLTEEEWLADPEEERLDRLYAKAAAREAKTG